MTDSIPWHQPQAPLGVLVVNLGTPVKPTVREVRRFLRAFLSDQRVVDIPRVFWWPILNGFIVPFRSRNLAHQYQSIWQSGGSPLLVNSLKQVEGLQTLLNQQSSEPIVVELSMTYGQPSIASGMRKLREQRVRNIVILPLYPQYSATTTAAVFDAVVAELKTWRWVPGCRFINHYADDPQYIQALVSSIQKRWQEQRGDYLLISFHGLPESSLREGDPYYCYCQKTGRLIAEQLGLSEQQWQIVFQSRFGRKAWLKPYCDEVLKSLPAQGKSRVDIICPGFASDCLETLEEIAIRNRTIFMEAGGEYYHYIPALNDDPLHLNALAKLILQG